MWGELRTFRTMALGVVAAACVSHASAQSTDPDLKPGFPVVTWHGQGSYFGGPSIHPTVGNIDGDPELEIIFSGLAQGPLYAFNHDGSEVSGWPVDMGYTVALPVIAKLSAATEESQVFAGAGGSPGPLAAFWGDGTLLPGWPRNSGNYVSTSPSAADIDGDGVDELFVCEENSRVNAYHADGTPVATWQPAVRISQRCTTPAIADLDGDGRLEVITAGTPANGSSVMVVFQSDGSLRPGFPVNFPGRAFTYPVVGDVDGDGASEIVLVASMSSSPWHIVVHVYSAQGQLERQIPVPEESFYGAAPALADLDLDGHPDIVVQARWNVYAIKGTTGTVLPGWPRNVGSDGNSAPAVGDVDGDGLPDVAVTSELGKVYLFDRLGNINSHFPKDLPLGKGGMPAIADIDLDGRNDLMVIGDFWNGTSAYYSKLWVYDLQGPSYGPIEWGQFGAGAQHRSVYVPKTSHQLTADLGIELVAAPQALRVGEAVNVTANITNHGPQTATQLQVIFSLPAALRLEAAAAGCSQSAEQVICRLDQLPNGASRSFTLSARAVATGTVQTTATLRSSSADAEQSNNVAVATSTIDSALPPAAADLAVTLTDTPDPARIGRDLVYVIGITNMGPNPADVARVEFDYPATVSFRSVPSNCAVGGHIVCNLGTIGAGVSTELRIVVTPLAKGTITGTATVSSTTDDPVGTNNTATATTTTRK